MYCKDESRQKLLDWKTSNPSTISAHVQGILRQAYEDGMIVFGNSKGLPKYITSGVRQQDRINKI
jgi:hypothetical protein